MCIPGFAEIALPVLLPKQYANHCVVLESLQNCRDLVAVAGTISQADGRRAVVKVLNFYTDPALPSSHHCSLTGLNNHLLVSRPSK